MGELIHVERVGIEDPVLFVQVLPRAMQRRIIDVVWDSDPVNDAERGEKPRHFEGRIHVALSFAGVPV